MISDMMNATVLAAALGGAFANGATPSDQTVMPPTVILAASDQVSGLARDMTRAPAPSRPGIVAGLMSDQRSPPQMLSDEMDALKEEMRRDEQTIQRLLDRIGDLSSVDIEDAYAAADQLIGIGTNIDRLLAEGGIIDERIKDARGYFRGLGLAVAESQDLSESRRDQLLDDINREQAALTVEIARLLELRGVVRTLTQKTRESREYLAFSYQVQVGGEIVDKIQELNETLSNMAAVLRQLADADAPAS